MCSGTFSVVNESKQSSRICSSQPERYFHLMLSQRKEVVEKRNAAVETISRQVDIVYTPNEERDEEGGV